MSDRHLPEVAGELECSLADVERRCRVYLGIEQEKISPDTGLIAALCDSVRAIREYNDFAKRHLAERICAEKADA